MRGSGLPSWSAMKRKQWLEDWLAPFGLTLLIWMMVHLLEMTSWP